MSQAGAGRGARAGCLSADGSFPSAGGAGGGGSHLVRLRGSPWSRGEATAQVRAAGYVEPRVQISGALPSPKDWPGLTTLRLVPSCHPAGPGGAWAALTRMARGEGWAARKGSSGRARWSPGPRLNGLPWARRLRHFSHHGGRAAQGAGGCLGGGSCTCLAHQRHGLNPTVVALTRSSPATRGPLAQLTKRQKPFPTPDVEGVPRPAGATGGGRGPRNGARGGALCTPCPTACRHAGLAPPPPAPGSGPGLTGLWASASMAPPAFCLANSCT